MGANGIVVAIAILLRAIGDWMARTSEEDGT